MASSAEVNPQMDGQVVPRLQVRGLGKEFTKRGERVEVLRDVNLTVHPGEFIAIVGASGCGKTTLLRVIDGLESATRGDIVIDGAPPGAGVSGRGFVFQKDNLFPWRSVLKNVALGLELRGESRSRARGKARSYIQLVGLEGFENHFPHELSGGMRQRANLARAFTIEPSIMLMDEPFAALDAQTREIMQTELLRMWGDSDDRAVMFITHQIDEAIFLADRVVVLTARPGQIKEIIDVPFDRPRTLDVKRTAEFTTISDRIWHMIEEEVLVSMGMA